MTSNQDKIFNDAQKMSDKLMTQLKIEGFDTPLESQWGQYKAYYPYKRFCLNEDDM